MKRPLFIIALSFLIGTILGAYVNKCMLLIYVIGFLGIIFTLVLLFSNNNRHKKQIISILILATILISFTYTVLENNKYNNICNKLNEKEITLEAVVCSSIKETDYTYQVTIRVLKIENSKFKNTQLNLMSKKGKDKTQINKLQYGNKIKVIGTFNKAEEARNYKGYSYSDYLKTKKIFGNMNCDNLENITVSAKNKENIINTSIYKISSILKENTEKILPKDEAGLLQGILLGDSSKISNEIKENFKDCNLSHMLAVSGAHLSYLIIAINLIFNKNKIGIRNNYIISIIIIIIFMLITGMSPSVVRAGICTIISIISTLLYRKQDSITTISIALLYTLIKNPFSIFDIGMQLSYAGTVSLILFYPEVQRKFLKNKKEEKVNKIKINKNLTTNGKISNTNNKENKGRYGLKDNVIEKIKNYVLDTSLVTICANILIMPIIIYNFNIISLNFIISNLATSQFLGFSIILGMLTVLTSLISIKLAKLLAIPLKILLGIIIKITNNIAKLPYANIIVITPHLVTIIIVYVVIFLAYFCIKKNKNPIKIIKKYQKKLIVILLIITITGGMLDIYNLNIQELQVYFVDVGQGDCTYIKTPTNKTILIDGGGSRDSSKYDVGEKVLLPYLLDRRVNKLDYIIVSHFDADHCQGLEAVLNTIKVKNIVVCKQATVSKLYQEIINICKKKKVNIIVTKRGQKLTIDKYVYFNILHPGDIMLDDGKGGLNANAIVAKMYYKEKFSILFTGDIEEDAEKELVKIYGNKLKCNILKVAHHGSKTSSTSEFLECVKPKIALIGVGKNNKFGHPNEGVLERLKNIYAHIYRTDQCGEISLKINKQLKYKITTYINKMNENKLKTIIY